MKCLYDLGGWEILKQKKKRINHWNKTINWTRLKFKTSVHQKTPLSAKASEKRYLQSIAHKGLVCRIYKGLAHLKRKKENLIGKQAKDLNRPCTKEDIQVANKYMKIVLNFTIHQRNRKVFSYDSIFIKLWTHFIKWVYAKVLVIIAFYCAWVGIGGLGRTGREHQGNFWVPVMF